MITYEFQTVHFPDRVFGTSSIMPQKKNPTVIEHLRGRAAQLMGSLTTTMAAIKGTNFTISIDGFFDALRGYYDSLNDTVDGLVLLDLVVRAAEPDAERMLDLVRGNFATVTDLTDALVREAGLSFREAHHVVGATVRLAVAGGLTADRITADLVDKAAAEVLGRSVSVPPETVRRSLDPAGAVADRDGIGGPAPDEVLRIVGDARGHLESNRRWIRERRDRIARARSDLKKEITALAGR